MKIAHFIAFLHYVSQKNIFHDLQLLTTYIITEVLTTFFVSIYRPSSGFQNLARTLLHYVASIKKNILREKRTERFKWWMFVQFNWSLTHLCVSCEIPVKMPRNFPFSFRQIFREKFTREVALEICLLINRSTYFLLHLCRYFTKKLYVHL